MIPTLETERTILRAPRPDDFEPYAAFRATERAAFVGGVLDRGQAWRSFAGLLGHWQLRGYGHWSVEETATGAFIGLVGLWYPADWLAREVAWMICSPAHEGRGFAAEAARRARAYAYRAAGWTEAFSVIAPGNVRSRALAERLGCTIDRTHAWDDGSTLDIWRHPGPEEARP